MIYDRKCLGFCSSVKSTNKPIVMTNVNPSLPRLDNHDINQCDINLKTVMRDSLRIQVWYGKLLGEVMLEIVSSKCRG